MIKASRRYGVTVLRILIVCALLAQGWTTLPAVVPLQQQYARSFIDEALVSRTLGQTQPDSYDTLLGWVASEVPSQAVLLILSPSANEDYWPYFRASYSLAPRTIWSGTPRPRTSPVDWYIQVKLDRDSFTRVLAQYHVDDVLVEDILPEDLPAIDQASVIWYGRAPVRYLIELPRAREKTP